MQTDPVARVYAQALLDLGRERNRMDAFGAELESVVAAVRGDDMLRTFLETPALDHAAKKRALEALRGIVDDVLVNFLCVLIEKGRIGSLAAISATYRDLADDAAGRVRVHAMTAVPLDDELHKRLLETLQQALNRECVLETEVRPGLVGGLVLQVGDKVYDGSVSRALRRVRTEMTRSSGYED